MNLNMKKLFLLFLTLLLTILSFLIPLQAANRGISVVSKRGQSLHFYNDYQALVVGVSNYELWPKLPNAANDAVEVAKKLKSMGIHVKLVLDPTYRELKTALTDMVYKMGREQNRGVLFYYAGHGETERLADGKNMGYIIPRDCPLLMKDPGGFANHAVSMREIESASLRIRSKHVLMLFDSCFSGALFALVRAVPHDITEKSTLPVRQYITAGREDEEVPDQSMFKRCLLIGLEGDADLTGDGYVTGSELGMYLADKVVNYTHRQQHPQYGKINNPDLDRGDFVFSVSRSPAPSQPILNSSLSHELQKLAEERAELEVERRKLAEMRALIAERKLLEKERKRMKEEERSYDIAKLPQDQKKNVPNSDELKNSDTTHGTRFTAYTNGTVLDKKTHLMWAGSTVNSHIYHYDAERYCEGYSGGGFADWRMPTLDELETIYNKNLYMESGALATKHISVFPEYIWANRSSWGGKAAFSLQIGSEGNFDFDSMPAGNAWALPVRSAE